MRIVGLILIVFGFLISLSIVGAVFGIPMMLIGLVMVIMGGRRHVITNVVQVTNAPASPQTRDDRQEGEVYGDAALPPPKAHDVLPRQASRTWDRE